MRSLIALLAVTAILAVGAVVAFAAPGAVGRAASLDGGAGLAAYCPKGEKARRNKAVTTYKKGMAAARAKYYKTHKRSKDRIAFVKRQNAQLAALVRRAKQCK